MLQQSEVIEIFKAWMAKQPVEELKKFMEEWEAWRLIHPASDET